MLHREPVAGTVDAWTILDIVRQESQDIPRQSRKRKSSKPFKNAGNHRSRFGGNSLPRNRGALPQAVKWAKHHDGESANAAGWHQGYAELMTIENRQEGLQFNPRCATMPLATAGRGQFGREPMMEMPESFGDSERSSKRRRTKRD